MCKIIWNIARINLKNLKVPYVITGIITALMIANIIVYFILALNGIDTSEQGFISAGNALWLLPVFAGIFIPAKNFRRIVNLGGKRSYFFWGSLECYAILSAAVSFANVLIYCTIDAFIQKTGYFDVKFFAGVVNLIEVFGWIRNGAVAAFLQQFAFLFLFAVFTHTLTAMQDKWYGWAADILLVAIISVFTPIAPLRSALAWFFTLILTHPNAFLQIFACIILAIAIYFLNRPIFARKAI
jgi:hypothetical protein